MASSGRLSVLLADCEVSRADVSKRCREVEAMEHFKQLMTMGVLCDDGTGDQD